MTKSEKYIFTVFCVILLVLAGFILIRYYHRVSDAYALSQNQEISEEHIPISGYTYTTESSELVRSENSEGNTAKRTFTHTVFTPENNALAVLTITVTGNTSADSFTISHISTSLSQQHQEGLTVSEHISGETATVVLYLNQISVCHFQYRLSTDGSIIIL